MTPNVPDRGAADAPAAAHDSPTRPAHTAYIGLGANLGERWPTLRQAVLRLRGLGVVEAISPVYDTAPVGFADQPSYLNATLRLATDLGPEALLAGLLQIEQDLGRVRTFPNAPRTIDLDLLFYDDAVIDHPDVVVPHPRVQERAFVLVPLSDIAPDLWHPQLECTVGALLRRLGAITGVQRTPRSVNDLVQAS